jgi:hypothetical protein
MSGQPADLVLVLTEIARTVCHLNV